MKIRFIFMILLLAGCTVTSHAQYASIFGAHSTDWKTVCYNLDIIWVDSFYSSTDTLVYGREYKIVRQSSGGMIALLREDTLTGRIWSLRGLGDCYTYGPDEVLICDMSLAISDTFDRSYASLGGDSLLIADSVYSERGRRVVRLRARIGSGYEDHDVVYFTEAAGPSGSVIWMAQGCTMCMSPYLLCTYKDGVQTDYYNMSLHGECDPVFTGIADMAQSRSPLYPNPANNSVTVPATIIRSCDRILICDLAGRILSEQSVKAEKGAVTLDLSGLAQGIYLVRTVYRDRPLSTYKVAVEH